MVDHVFPQNSDPDDAANFGQHLGRDNISDYVEEGMNFTVDYTVPDLTVSAGKAFTLEPSAVANQEQETRSFGVDYTTEVAQKQISLDAGVVNHIFLKPDVGNDDTPDIVAQQVDSTPTAASLKIGEVDTSNNTKVELNREPEVEVEGINSVSVVNPTMTDAQLTEKIDSAGVDGLLLWTEGTYNVSTTFTLYSGLTMAPLGDGGVVVRVADNAGVSGHVFNGTADSVTILDFEFDGNHANQTDPDVGAISLTGAHNHIEGCYIHDFWVDDISNGHGVQIKSDGYNTVTDNRIENCGRTLVGFENNSATGNDEASDNLLRQTEDNPYVTTQHQLYGVLAQTKETLVEDNVIDFSGVTNTDYQWFGVVPTAKRISVISNRIKNTLGEGIYGQNDGLRMFFNDIGPLRNPTSASSPINYNIGENNCVFAFNYVREMHGGYLINGKDNIVVGNEFEDMRYGVSTLNPTDGSNSQVLGNTFRNFRASGSNLTAVRIQGDTNILIGWNQIKDADTSSNSVIVKEDSSGNKAEALVQSNYLQGANFVNADGNAEIWARDNFVDYSNAGPFEQNGGVIHVDQNIGYVSESGGSDTQSGDGTTVTFTISHGLDAVPSTVDVSASTEDASTDFWISNVTSSVIELTYAAAPPSGTDNLSWYWEAEV